MTKKQIRESFITDFLDDGERIVDINKFDAYYTFVNIVTISKNHVIWKYCFEIVDGNLVFLDSKLLV